MDQGRPSPQSSYLKFPQRERRTVGNETRVGILWRRSRGSAETPSGGDSTAHSFSRHAHAPALAPVIFPRAQQTLPTTSAPTTAMHYAHRTLSWHIQRSSHRSIYTTQTQCRAQYRTPATAPTATRSRLQGTRPRCCPPARTVLAAC